MKIVSVDIGEMEDGMGQVFEEMVIEVLGEFVPQEVGEQLVQGV